jgi:hypothetical protein
MLVQATTPQGEAGPRTSRTNEGTDSINSPSKLAHNFYFPGSIHLYRNKSYRVTHYFDVNIVCTLNLAFPRFRSLHALAGL